MFFAQPHRPSWACTPHWACSIQSKTISRHWVAWAQAFSAHRHKNYGTCPYSDCAPSAREEWAKDQLPDQLSEQIWCLFNFFLTHSSSHALTLQHYEMLKLWNFMSRPHHAGHNYSPFAAVLFPKWLTWLTEFGGLEWRSWLAFLTDGWQRIWLRSLGGLKQIWYKIVWFVAASTAAGYRGFWNY
jgi:hypothetical protein